MSSTKEAKAAFKKAQVWGTPVLLGQADAIIMLKEKISRSREHLTDDSAGQPFHTAADQGLVTCGGDLTCYLRYQGLETLLALALGQAGEPSALGGGAQAHALRLAPIVDGLFGTLGIYKGFSAHEYPSIKVDGLTISGEAGQPLTVAFHLIGDDLNVNAEGGVNTAANLAALVLPAPTGRVLFRQGGFLINDAAGPALDASHAVAPGKFSLTFKRKLVGDHLAGLDDRIAEPVAAGFPEATLNLEFPTYTSDTFLHDLGNDTRKKMRMVFRGEAIGGGHLQTLEILLPHLALTNAEAAVDKAGKIAHPLTFDLLGALSAPAGMEGVTAPLAVNLVNGRGTDPLG
jgi:hypothetical protein